MGINTAYSPLGLPTLNGNLIGVDGELIDKPNEFDYRPSLAEAEFCGGLFTAALPKGKYWEAHGVVGTTDYALSVAVGEMLAVLFAYQAYLRKELDINTTEDLIQEWEESVGLPEPCTLNSANSLEERRELVKLHLAKKAFVTVAEFEEIVLKLTGYDVIILPRRNPQNPYADGLDIGWLDLSESMGAFGDRFTFDVFVDFSDNQFGLGVDDLDADNLDQYLRPPFFIECVFNKIKPANSLAVYHYDSTLYNVVKSIGD